MNKKPAFSNFRQPSV